MNGNEQTFSRTETMHLKAPFFSGSEASSEKLVTIGTINFKLREFYLT
jgi:hypothetical protein